MPKKTEYKTIKKGINKRTKHIETVKQGAKNAAGWMLNYSKDDPHTLALMSLYILKELNNTFHFGGEINQPEAIVLNHLSSKLQEKKDA